MIADDTQEELSMEEILSSIKDILDEDMQGGNTEKAEAQSVSQPLPAAMPEVSAPVVEKSEPLQTPEPEEKALDISSDSADFAIPDFSSLMKEEKAEDVVDLPVAEDAEEDIFDLSSAMIIPEETPQLPEPETESPMPELPVKEESSEPLAEPVTEEEPETAETPAFDDLGLPDISLLQEDSVEEQAERKFSIMEPVAENNAEERSLLSDILKTEDVVPETAEEPLKPLSEEEFSEYTVDEIDLDSEPFYPDVPSEENVALPVVEPEESRIVNNDVLDSYQQQENNMLHAENTEETESVIPDGDDVNDVSAGIINSFAKMFSHAEEVAPEPRPKKDYGKVESIGNGALTIEDIVESVVYDVVSSRVDTALQDNTTIENFAKNEIARQTQIWLTTQMPSLLEALVKKEIERVMAKVGR